MAITCFYHTFFVERCLILLPLALGESSQKQVLLQNNSIRKSIKLISGAKEIQGEPCCSLVIFFKNFDGYITGSLGPAGSQIRKKEILNNFFYFAFRANSRAGENNGRFFKFKVAEKFYQINTNNFHNYDHA